MLVIDIQQCHEFIAGDGTTLREILHPGKQHVSLRYSLAHAVVNPGESSIPHKLATSEIYYILQGRGVMHINDEQAEVAPGHTIYISPHATQYIHNPGPGALKFLCIVDPAWRAEDEEVL